MGGLRTERRQIVGSGKRLHTHFPAHAMARRGVVGAHREGSILHQLRSHHHDARGHIERPTHLRNRRRSSPACGIHYFPCLSTDRRGPTVTENAKNESDEGKMLFAHKEKVRLTKELHCISVAHDRIRIVPIRGKRSLAVCAEEDCIGAEGEMRKGKMSQKRMPKSARVGLFRTARSKM